MMSKLFAEAKPSAIREAMILFNKRHDKDEVMPVNTALGNVTLPIHPKVWERLSNLGSQNGPFANGSVGYSATAGLEETREAFLNIIRASDLNTDGLHVLVTNGGSQGMRLVMEGVADPVGRPVLLIDPAYTNYTALARQHGINTVSVKRTLDKDGVFSLPTREKIEAVIEETKPTAMVVIPYDNPTGQYFSQEQMDELGELAVKYDLWLISDEAYRELHYLEAKASSIWGISEGKVPGITGRRIGLETASKVFNGCGLRIGAIVSDNEGFFESAQAVATAELCANAIGQWAYGALAHESRDELQRWFGQQREYYRKIMSETVIKLRQVLPGVIVSQPSASIYSVVDMRDLDPAFDASEFVKFCAQTGRVDVNGRAMTLLVTPMDGFYSVKANEPNPGKTQMRLAYVEKPEIMELVPEIFAKLYDSYRNVSHQT